MKLKMADNSLFAILLRSPWWVSIGVAVGIVLIAWAALPAQYALAAALGGIPFLVVGLIAAWKQLRMPSARNVAATLQSVGAMSWRDFSGMMEDAFRRDGYVVTRLNGPEADFEITKSARMALVSCKRWKAANTGIDPLRDLHAAMKSREARESIYVTIGEMSDNARRFAIEKKIRVVQGVELAQLLRGMAPLKKDAA
jgi:restriction system protein